MPMKQILSLFMIKITMNLFNLLKMEQLILSTNIMKLMMLWVKLYSILTMILILSLKLKAFTIISIWKKKIILNYL